MSRGMFSSGDSQFTNLWGAAGLAVQLSTDSRLPSGLAANLTAAAARALADGYAKPSECGMLIGALKRVIEGKEV